MTLSLPGPKQILPLCVCVVWGGGGGGGASGQLLISNTGVRKYNYNFTLKTFLYQGL